MKRKTTLIIGSFDGLHIGHFLLFKKAKYPINVILVYNITSKNNNHIYTVNERIRQLLKAGAENIFTYDVLNNNMNANEFIKKIIYKLSPSEIIVGDDFIFGCDRKSFQNCKINIPVILVKKNKNISSRIIRDYLINANIEKANKLFLFNYYSSGFVVQGNKIARKLNFPTANINIDDNLLLLKQGSYCGYTYVNNVKYKSVIFYGNSKTFKEKNEKKVQTHILDFRKNIYHQQIFIFPVSFIRPNQRFNNSEELIKLIDKDVKTTYRRLK